MPFRVTESDLTATLGNSPPWLPGRLAPSPVVLPAGSADGQCQNSEPEAGTGAGSSNSEPCSYWPACSLRRVAISSCALCHVRMRWQLAQTTSHLAISASSEFRCQLV